MKIKSLLVINGPNMNMLGIREPEIYGRQDYKALCEFINNSAFLLGLEIEIYQSNHEGDIIDKIQASYGAFDGIVINPGGYTHTSVSILDALKAVNIPAVEVHLSDIESREEFRKFSFVSLYAEKVIKGQGFEGYRKALEYLKENH